MDILINTCLGSSLVMHFFYFERHYKARFLNTDEIFSRILTVGVTAVTLVLIPHVLQLVFDKTLTESHLLIRLLFALNVYSAVFYFPLTLHLFRKLMFERKLHLLDQQWQILRAVLLVSVVARFFYLMHVTLLVDILLFGELLTMLPLLVRWRWIALIEKRDKLWGVFYLFSINLSSFALVQQLWQMETLPTIIHQPFKENIFLMLAMIFVCVYGLVALLSLLFNIPIATIIEEQREEMKNFQAIGQVVRRRGISDDIYQNLLQIFCTSTASDAAWVVVLPAQKKEEIIYALDITADSIELINMKVNFYDLLQADTRREVQYFTDLRKPVIYLDEDNVHQSLLILFLMNETQEMEAVFCLAKKFVEGYDEYLINLCKGYLEQTQLAFHNARLMQDTVNAMRDREELVIAKTVQKSLLPQRFPATTFCDIVAFNKSAKDVGGDYYDYTLINDNQLAVVMADVSGKGTSAAFHMAQMKGIFQSLMQLCLPRQIRFW